QPLRPAHHTLRIAAPPGGIQPPPPTSPLTSLARRSRFVQPRGKQRARVKPLHIPNGSAGRAAYLAFLFARECLLGTPRCRNSVPAASCKTGSPRTTRTSDISGGVGDCEKGSRRLA